MSHGEGALAASAAKGTPSWPSSWLLIKLTLVFPVPPILAWQAQHGECDVSHVMCCRAVTSAGSAELIAVSSLFTYDGYWHYINPRAGGKQLLVVSKIMVLVYTVLVSLLLSKTA